MDYWKEHFNENVKKSKESFLKQVDMTVNGKEVDNTQVDLRTDSIRKNLNLQTSDILLDICCGNGLITKKLAQYVSFIYAIDFSEELIKVANNFNMAANIIYILGDAVNMNYSRFSKVNKICLQSCWQYLSNKEVSKFLNNLSVLNNIIVYISNIPDKEKIWNYYDTDEKKSFYLQREKEGKPHIGTWWKKKEVEKIVKDNGFKCKFLTINKNMNTSYYRFDVLLSK
jgi:SAM-dependent methyltransferase